jgi:outer membrane protein assembly factor BamD
MRGCLVLALLLTLSGCGKKVPVQSAGIVEQDRELYETAMQFLKKNRFIAARLALQTLLDTYQDSEFGPQAKYAYAETFYRESGHSALMSAEVEFRQFITFFPDHELSDDAQLMVAMTHMRQLQRPDRDDTEARLAEYELTEMISMYPDSPLLDEAKAKLRAVQELLAESILGPARQYYMRRAYPAVADRCLEILKKYPDFSGTDRVLFLLGETVQKVNPPESATYYAQIVRDYPLSDLVKDSKKHLAELQAPIPEPSPAALERAKVQQAEGKGVLGVMTLGLFGGGAEVSKDTKAASAKDPDGALSIGPQP